MSAADNRMMAALRAAARHPQGMVFTNEKTHMAMVRRGWVSGVTITDAGRAAVSA